MQRRRFGREFKIEAVHRAKHPKIDAINAFINWAQRCLNKPG